MLINAVICVWVNGIGSTVLKKLHRSRILLAGIVKVGLNTISPSSFKNILKEFCNGWVNREKHSPHVGFGSSPSVTLPPPPIILILLLLLLIIQSMPLSFLLSYPSLYSSPPYPPLPPDE